MTENIVQAITLFVTTVFQKAGAEIGKNAAKDVYDKLKNIFNSSNQKALLDNLKKEPDSQSLQEAFDNEISTVLSQNDTFPKEIRTILTMMRVNTTILGTMFKSYKKLEFDHTIEYIKWTNSKGGTDEEGLKTIRMYEDKMRSLTEKASQMLHSGMFAQNTSDL